MSETSDTGDEIDYKNPKPEDGLSIYTLVKNSPPLDINSLYYYLIFCSHFKKTSIVARKGNQTIGFISAYIHPEKKDTLFIWQVAVDKSCRGLSIGKKMINHLLNEKANSKVNYIETTVTPSNKASEALFNSIARQYDTRVTNEVFFEKDLFGLNGHEPEMLFRIGPFNK